jgi:hypothetical protein
MLNPKAASSGEFNLDMRGRGLAIGDDLLTNCSSAQTLPKHGNQVRFHGLCRHRRDKEKRFNYHFGHKGSKTIIGEKIGELSKFCDEIKTHYGMLNAVLMEKRDSATEAAEFYSLRPDITLRIIDTKNNDKEQRMKKLAPIAQQNRLFVNLNMKEYDMMCSELIGFSC